MKNFSLLLFWVLFFVFAASAQTDQTSSCPIIRLSGGNECTKAGGTVGFTVKVENYDLSKLSYRWITSSGEILEGQGTTSINVLKGNRDITATVEVIGLPNECPVTASETEVICDYPRPRLLDEFSISALQIDKMKLNNFINELQEDSSVYGLIIEYFKRNTSQRIINQKIQKITDYLVNVKKIKKERFKILTKLENEKNFTRFWRVPASAEEPAP